MRRGILGNIYALFSIMVTVAIILAILWQFNWDAVAAVMWVVNLIVDTTLKIAEYITKMPMFRALFH